MCPACYASLAWTIAGASSATGVATIAVVKTIKKKNKKKQRADIDLPIPEAK